ncbi:hypothetical protein MKW94_008774 [Papaver nudicaule]|uniref:NPH3 domain-containing protein n=1 Tax=Papaver nudicaule TaxID=74823 RepID=A0AA41SKY0_PAPNU|nr:hypothetical protein [Papaver nudicaule]
MIFIEISTLMSRDLNKSERKQICRILDCKKLSAETCMHASLNELIPLRMVVQLSFIKHARASMTGGIVIEIPNNFKVFLGTHDEDSLERLPPVRNITIVKPMEEELSISGSTSPNSIISTLSMKLTEDEDQMDDVIVKNTNFKLNSFQSFRFIPARPKKMLSRLLSLNRITRSQDCHFNLFVDIVSFVYSFLWRMHIKVIETWV